MAVASKTYSVGEVLTAATMNTYVRDNFSDVESNYLKFYSGSYTGDGATSQAITGVGFTPLLVHIVKKTTDTNTAEEYWTMDTIMDDDADGGAIFHSNGDGFPYFYDNCIISLDADGFTVDDAGADNSPNANGLVYNFWCLGTS